MKSRSVSITGATGFVGSHLARAFRDSGWQVRAITRPGRVKAVPDGVDVVQSALAVASLADAFAGTDVVVHSAALIRAPSEAVFNATNVEGTRAVVEAANRTGARLVHVSSLGAIGPAPPNRPAREDDPPHPVNAYGRSKLASEAVVRAEARTPWTIVRPSAVYGPRDRGFLPLFRLASRGLFFYAAPPQTAFTFLYVEDLVEAIRCAAIDDRAVGETFFVGYPEPATSDQLLRSMAEALGKSYRPRCLAPILLDAAAALGELAWALGHRPPIDRGRLAELRAEGFVCSVDRLRDRLGFTPATPLAAGIERAARWYQEQRWI